MAIPEYEDVIIDGKPQTYRAEREMALPPSPCSPLTTAVQIADYIEPKIAEAMALLDAAVKEFKPKMVVGLMSGGDDSIPACYVASLHPAFSGILHVNTGIGIEATREHVRWVCANRKWRLWEYKALENVNAKGDPDPMSYDNLVIGYGFPGAFGHQLMYSRLKERQLRRFERDMGALPQNGERILYVSGIRREESARRKNRDVMRGYGRHAFVCPLIHWGREDCGYARLYAKIPRNPVSEKIGKSGECLCGAFAHPGELAEIAYWFPEDAQRIRDLEKRVRDAGFPWGWEDKGPPEWWKQMRVGQCDFLADGDAIPVEMQHLCHSCNKQARVENADRHESPGHVAPNTK